MKLTQSAKKSLFEEMSPKSSIQDTGAVESQAALFTHRIDYLTKHLREHRKDYSSKLGLTRLVGKRKRLLTYLKKVNLNRYRAVLAGLKLRK